MPPPVAERLRRSSLVSWVCNWLLTTKAASLLVKKGGSAIDILQLLDDLEEVIGAGWPVPGVGRAMVDVDRATELIESIREHLPQEMESARSVMAERETC